MKRIFLVAAVAILAAILVSQYVQKQRASARRLAAWQVEREDATHPPVMDKKIAWTRLSVMLGEFAEMIKDESGLAVEIDHEAIAADASRRSKASDPFGPSGAKPKQPSGNDPFAPAPRFVPEKDIWLTIPGGDFSLEELLPMVLRPAGLAADWRGGKIVVTSVADSAAEQIRTVVYPLPQPKPVGMSEADWQAIIEANIFDHAVHVPGAIVVAGRAADQERVKLIIETICSLRSGERKPVAIPPLPMDHVEARIWTELDRKTNVDFVEQPLKDVMMYFAELHNIPIIVLADKLREASVPADTPVTKTLRGVSLRSALHLILKDLELTYAVRERALVITTPEDAEARVRTVAYGMHDLTELGGVYDVDSLAELIRSVIAPDKWGDGNGGGPRAVENGWMLVHQTDDVHEQIGSLLTTMRRVLRSSEHVLAQSIAPPSNIERRIRTALEQPIQVDFRNQPLKDVVMYLGELLRIPLVMSIKKLEEASLYPDSPITAKVSGVQAKAVLEQLLQPLKLDFVIRDEVLQITTPEDVEAQLVTRVYDARAIVATMTEQSLRDLIQTTIQPHAWDSTGGPGNVDVYRGLLVVSQTDRIHDEVERLVEKLTATSAEAK